jgi:hypothetical protein
VGRSGRGFELIPASAPPPRQPLDEDTTHQRFIEACFRTGTLDRALEHFRRLRQLQPDDVKVERALRQVAMILEVQALGSERNDRRFQRETHRAPLRVMGSLIGGLLALLALATVADLLSRLLH